MLCHPPIAPIIRQTMPVPSQIMNFHNLGEVGFGQIDSGLALLGASPPSSGSWELLVLFFCLAIGISFFCSVWEAVLLSVSRPYIASLKRKRPKIGKDLEDLKNRINRPLTSILTLNTVAHTMGAMGVASQVSLLFGGAVWEAIAGGLMTLTVLIASEIIPKNLGATHWRAWAPWVTVCLKWLSMVMNPVTKTIGFFYKNDYHSEGFSRDEFAVMAEIGRREGKLKEEEALILANLLRLREVTVSDVKTPRVVVFALKKTTTVGGFVAEHAEIPFSRIPIFENNCDDIVGFVLKVDILLSAAKGKTDLELQTFMREVSMVNDFAKLPDAFKVLTGGQRQLAIVLDEFGGMSGLVTMEDIVETLLGFEIVDEADTMEDMRAFARTMWKKRAARPDFESDKPK